MEAVFGKIVFQSVGCGLAGLVEAGCGRGGVWDKVRGGCDGLTLRRLDLPGVWEREV